MAQPSLLIECANTFTNKTAAGLRNLVFCIPWKAVVVAERSPADIARETLKLLASRRLAPTPSNYQAIYEEVAGLVPQISFPQTALRRIASILPTQTPIQKRIAHSFASAVEAQDWTALQSAITDYAQLDLGISPKVGNSVSAPPSLTLEVLPTSLAQQLARLIETTMVVLGDEDQRMRDLSEQLANFLDTAPPPLATLEQMLHNYSYRLSFTSEDQAQRRRGIQALLRMAGQHIASIATHDQRLQHQAQALMEAMAQPWTLAQLDTLQIHLKNLLARHLEIEGNRAQAHDQLKALLAAHTAQLSSLGKLSESHAQALTTCAQQIQQAQDLGDLTVVLESVVQSGSALATESRIAQAQMEDLRAQNQAQELALERLAGTLSLVEDSTRHDPETGALNTLGLQEALLAEAARSQRHQQSTSLAALQLDELDARQTQAGMGATSAALVHLARLVRSTLRPQDALARLGAHQFALLFPETEATQAAQALARLQKEFSERPLIFEEQSASLNFSAGVIATRPSETPMEAIRRAHQACEQAQRMGKARVALG